MRDWAEESVFAVTLCDEKGKITYMNAAARRTFSGKGGGELVGKDLLDCHPEPARTKLRGLLSRPAVNAYTIEKGGKRKLIYQAPLTADGKPAGLVELSLELPEELPHFIRRR